MHYARGMALSPHTEKPPGHRALCDQSSRNRVGPPMHPWRHTLQDITVFNMPAERAIGAIPRPDVPAWAFGTGHGEDQALACLLITKWTLLTGRTLRTDVPLDLLSAEELISFWADQEMAEGRAEQDGNGLPGQVRCLTQSGPRADVLRCRPSWRRAS